MTPDRNAVHRHTALSLAWQISKRTISATYRRSFLGYFWIVFPTLVVSTGAMLAAQAGAVNLNVTSGLPIFASLFLAVMLWQSFAEMVDVPARALEGARSYLTRVSFPGESIIIAQSVQLAITGLIRLVCLLAMLIVVGVLDVAGFLSVLLCLLCAWALGLSLGTILAPFMILFADLKDFIRQFIGFGIFLTPTFYSPEGGFFNALLLANPISHLIIYGREMLAAGTSDQGYVVLGIAVASVPLSVLGIYIYRISIPILVERMLLGGR